jgi:hypothetical protein
MSILAAGSFLVYGMSSFGKAGFEKASKAKNWEDIHKLDLT